MKASQVESDSAVLNNSPVNCSVGGEVVGASVGVIGTGGSVGPGVGGSVGGGVGRGLMVAAS